MVRTSLNLHFNQKAHFYNSVLYQLVHTMYVSQTFRSGSEVDIFAFWEGKSLNFGNILTRLTVVSILLRPLCDQDTTGSTKLHIK